MLDAIILSEEIPLRKALSMFKNLWLDRTKNQMHLWSTDGSYNIYEFKCKSYELAPGLENATMRTVDGIPVRAVYDTCIDERNKINANVRNMESDIQPEIRFISEFYKDVEHLKFNFKDFNVCYFDIEVEVESGFPEPALAERRINLISAYGSKSNKFYTFGLEKDLIEHIYLTDEEIRSGVFPEGHEEVTRVDDEGVVIKEIKYYVKKKKVIKLESATASELGYSDEYEYIRCSSEEELLEKFFQYFSNERFDILTGWNCLTFDVPYMVRRCEKLGLFCHRKFSPVNRVYLTERRNDFNKIELIPTVGGLSILDMYQAYKKANLKQLEDNKLATVSSIELGVSKIDLGPDGLKLYKKGQNGWSKFVHYNVVDVELLVQLEHKKHFLESIISVCADARIPLEYFFISKRVTLGFMMNYMHSKGLVIPHPGEQERIPFEGAYIVANPGAYRNVVSYDFKAMYPSIISSANISPERKFKGEVPPEGSYSKSVIKNVWYDNSKVGIIPEIVSMVVDDRDKYKELQKLHSNPSNVEKYDSELASFYKRKQEAYKIYANSIYGLLGNRFFQFYDVDNAASVTGIGRYLIQYCIDYIIKWFDIGLPKSEKFKHEFGEYANVTIKGLLDDAYINSQPDRDTLGKYKRLVLAHTDSFFLDFSDIYSPFIGRKRTLEEFNALRERYSNEESPDYNKAVASILKSRFEDGSWPEMSLSEFALRLEHCAFGEVRTKILNKWATENNYRENRLWLKLEKCCNHLIELTRSHYICYLEYDEGDDLINSSFDKRFKPVGVAIVKSDTPAWSKKNIKHVLEMILNNEPKDKVLSTISALRRDFKNPENIHLISKAVSINTLDASVNGVIPAPRKGARVFNAVIESNSEYSIYEPITEGTKAKWIYVKTPNKFETDVVTFNTSKWPTFLNNYFIIDHETQFEKVFKKPLSKILETMGWGNIFEGNMDLMSKYIKTPE